MLLDALGGGARCLPCTRSAGLVTCSCIDCGGRDGDMLLHGLRGGLVSGEWLVCVLIFSALIGAAARLVDLALPDGVARRFVWAAALVVSTAAVGASLLTGGIWPVSLLPTTPALDLSALLAAAARDAAGPVTPLATESILPSLQVAPAAPVLWATLSALLLAFYLAVWVRFAGASSEWRVAHVAGRSVRVARDMGPAVLGVFRATIVVPEWVLRADPAVQRMIMLHETEHERARDHALLAVAPLLLVLLPWNLPLWWQLHRLRLAVEVDCDRRVLRRGIGAREYGTLLIDIASRSVRMSPTIAALAEPRTLLERRILAMSTRAQPRRLRSAVLTAAAALLLLTAFETLTFMTPAAAALHRGIPAAADGTDATPSALPAPLRSDPLQADTPLVVVDGVIIAGGDVQRAVGDATVVNIEVLKGAAALERFGAPATRGAILITTSAARPAAAEQARVPPPGTPTLREIVVPGGLVEGAQRPLFIVDGVIFADADPLRDMHPDAIEAIEIVKGPAAERLYGARAAHGVVRITTRRR